MEFDLSWILLGLPLAFILGWVASRMDLRQLRLENRQTPKAYFKGLNHLLNEQQDQAIDAFIEAVQHDPDTSELHFALGNLFRRRGEYDRAVRVHEHLLSRADLSQSDRQRAQHGLALDYLKAGLLDRAEEALRRTNDELERRVAERTQELRELANHLESVREIERRVEKSQAKDVGTLTLPKAPPGELDNFDAQVKLQFDLLALAYQARLTRVSTYMMVSEGTNRTYNHIGVPDAFHPLSHHANDVERLEKLGL